MPLGILRAKNTDSQLTNKAALIDALREANAAAICIVATKIAPDIRRAAVEAKLTQQDVEELINDALVILIKSIREGKFEFQGYHPAAYAVGVAKKLIANRLRTRKPVAGNLDEVTQVSDFDPAIYLNDKERQAIVAKLLLRLGEVCRNLVTLKFFKNLKDKEIIDKKLAAFSSINSLKSKRSQCLKKLAAIAKEAGITQMF